MQKSMYNCDAVSLYQYLFLLTKNIYDINKHKIVKAAMKWNLHDDIKTGEKSSTLNPKVSTASFTFYS